MHYVRFVVAALDPDSGFRQGVFQAMSDLETAGGLYEFQLSLWRKSGRWFDRNLPKPERFTRTRNASHKRKHGLSWFKESATEHIQRVRELCQVLADHDIFVETVISARPGYIVYQGRIPDRR